MPLYNTAIVSKVTLIAQVSCAYTRNIPATQAAARCHPFSREYRTLTQMALSAYAFNRFPSPPPVREAALASPLLGVWHRQHQTGHLSSQHGSLLCRALHSQHFHQRHPLEEWQESVPGVKAQVPKPVTSIRERVIGYLRESLLLSYTALFDNVIFSAFEWLQLDKVLKWLTPHLEDGYAALTGVQDATVFNQCCSTNFTCLRAAVTVLCVLFL